MMYRWSKKDLTNYLENNPEEIESLEEMLGIIEKSIDLYKFDLTPANARFSFKRAYNNYADGLYRYPEWLLDSLLYYFKIDNDIDYITKDIIVKGKRLTNKELIELGYECINELQSKELLKLYKEMIDRNNHLLHITNDIDGDGKTSILCGITYHLDNKKNYIALFKENSYLTFLTFIHEVMHAYFFKVLSSTNYYFLNEIEGRFGEYIAIKQLEKMGLDKVTKNILEYELRGTLNSSYLLYMNDLLFGTNINNKFDIETAKKIYEEELNKPWTLTKKKIYNYCSIFGRAEANDLFGFLILTDLIEKGYDNKELFRQLRILKMSDNEDILNHLNDLDITFTDDDYKSARAFRERVKGRN